MPKRPLAPLTLTALGVVYGDIGTSPLYALRECFFGSHSVPPTHDNVLGVLSLIIYSLLLVISVKYIAIVMRADNQGEGGVLALTALIPGRAGGASGVPRLATGRPLLIALGIFGTALLYGDGMITPAISVLGAIEGLEVATPLFQPYVVPATVAILVGLFLIQRYGTHRVGGLFGPIMVVWFVTLAAAGRHLDRPIAGGAPRLRSATWRWTSSRVNGFAGFAVLGAVFLVVTGGEALYADMGHFGKRPIRVAWFALVLPSLILNYLGQGALLLSDPTAEHPFFLLAPVVGAAAPRRALDGRRDHRVAGPHLRLVLHHPAGDTARAGAASRGGAHVGPRDGADLRPAGQLGTDAGDGGHRDRLRIVHGAGRRLRHRRHADDGHHRAAALRRHDGTVAVAEAGGRSP